MNFLKAGGFPLLINYLKEFIMVDSNTMAMLDFYNEGLTLYKKKQFKEAKEKFEEALKLVPNDGPCQLYINRCEDYIANPPPDDWDGVYTMTTK